ncbi:MAG: dihydroorotate dehydrogenase [Candidatus Omnitrophota bacterium]
MLDLKIQIGKVTFKNPVWVASGTFGYGEDYADFLDLSEVGAIVTKTVTLQPRDGNPPPRIVETSSGLLNSIGLENKGLEHFKKEHYPFLKKLGTRIMVSVAGITEQEFLDCSEKLMDGCSPDAVELNLSCPNVAHKEASCWLFSQDAKATERIVSGVKKKIKCTLVVKLTPNVTDITEIARAAEAGGADAVSLVNTYAGMAVDAQTMEPSLGNVIGGLSGPAIKPLALKAVWEVYGSIRIPVIGIGGIMTGTDVAEFMLCGARAVQVGTANFVTPDAYAKILQEFKEYLKEKKISKAGDLVGKIKVKRQNGS